MTVQKGLVFAIAISILFNVLLVSALVRAQNADSNPGSSISPEVLDQVALDSAEFEGAFRQFAAKGKPKDDPLAFFGERLSSPSGYVRGKAALLMARYSDSDRKECEHAVLRAFRKEQNLGAASSMSRALVIFRPENLDVVEQVANLAKDENPRLYQSLMKEIRSMREDWRLK